MYVETGEDIVTGQMDNGKFSIETKTVREILLLLSWNSIAYIPGKIDIAQELLEESGK